MVKEMTFDQKIIYYYCTRKFSIRQTAARLNVHASTVRKQLKEDNLIRTSSEALKLRSTDEYRKKLGKTKRGENHPSNKLTEKKVLQIRSEYSQLLTTYQKTEAQYILAQQYNVSRSTILDVIHNRTWRHLL